MDLHEANMRAGGPGQKPSPGQLGSPHEVNVVSLFGNMETGKMKNTYELPPNKVNNLKQQLADAKSKIEALEKALDEKQKQIVELEGKLKVRRIIAAASCSNGLQMQMMQFQAKTFVHSSNLKM